MTIAELGRQGKAFLGRIPTSALVVILLILTGTGSFFLGMLAERDMKAKDSKDSLWIEQLPANTIKSGGPAAVIEAREAVPASKTEAVPAPEPAKPAEAGVYMASKNGTKYYLPTCGSAKRIKEENKVWFATKEEAVAAGYEPAANCPGL